MGDLFFGGLFDFLVGELLPRLRVGDPFLALRVGAGVLDLDLFFVRAITAAWSVSRVVQPHVNRSSISSGGLRGLGAAPSKSKILPGFLVAGW